MAFAGRAVKHREAVLVLVQETRAAREQNLHHARVTFLDRAPERSGSVLTFGVNILANLNQKLSDISEASDGCVMKSSVSKFIFL